MTNIIDNLITYLSNIWVGTGIGMLFSVFLIGITMLSPHRKATPITYIICLLPVPFIAYQISRIYGAYTLKDYIETLTVSTNHISHGIISVINESDIKNNELVDILSLIMPGMNEIQDFITDLASKGDELSESVNEYINAYIFRRILWLCLFLVISAAGVFLSLSKDNEFAGGNRRSRYKEHGKHRSARSKRTHRY